MKYYTFVGVRGNTLFHRYVENGERHIDIVKNYPYELFIKSKTGEFTGLYGNKLKRLEFDTINDLKEFISKTSKDKIYGNLSPVQQFIVKEYPHIAVDDALYKTLVFDIETNHSDGLQYNKYDLIEVKINGKRDSLPFYKLKTIKGNFEVNDPFYKKWILYNESSLVDQNIGFPDANDPIAEILSISYKIMIGKNVVKSGCFGLETYKGSFNNFIVCGSEKELITQFINLFVDEQFDFITSWNGVNFDIPYFVSRALKVVGQRSVNKLSPFSAYIKNPVTVNKRAINLEYDIFGITHLDYLELYKKYAPKKQERYSLDHISFVELNERKVDYSKYNNSLMNLYSGVYKVKEDCNSSLSIEDRWCRLRTIVENKLDERFNND